MLVFFSFRVHTMGMLMRMGHSQALLKQTYPTSPPRVGAQQHKTVSLAEAVFC
jgi:hypothetical protein